MSVPKAELEALSGNWQEGRFGLWLTLALKDEKLLAEMNGRKDILAPAGPGKFIVPGSEAGIAIEFKPAEKGKPATALLTVGKTQEFRFAKAAPLKAMGAAELAAYAGAYVSEELLDARYLISVDKGTLVLKTRDYPAGRAQGDGPGQVHGPRVRAEH